MATNALLDALMAQDEAPQEGGAAMGSLGYAQPSAPPPPPAMAQAPAPTYTMPQQNISYNPSAAVARMGQDVLSNIGRSWGGPHPSGASMAGGGRDAAADAMAAQVLGNIQRPWSGHGVPAAPAMGGRDPAADAMAQGVLNNIQRPWSGAQPAAAPGGGRSQAADQMMASLMGGMSGHPAVQGALDRMNGAPPADQANVMAALAAQGGTGAKNPMMSMLSKDVAKDAAKDVKEDVSEDEEG